MFNRYHNSLTLGKMGVSEQHHFTPAGALNSTNNLSGMMNLKSHYNLAGGRDTIINRPQLVSQTNNSITAYYFDSTDRSTWVGWPGTNYVPLFNNYYQDVTGTQLKRGDLMILIMHSARGSFHVPQNTSVLTKNRQAFWNSFGAFNVASSNSLSAHWIRIPQNATDDQLLNEYPFITRSDVVANNNMGSSTSVQNITDGTVYVLRGVPTNRSPTLNFNITGSWSDADTNEIAQKTTLQDFGKYNTLYLNFVYTQIVTTSSPPDAYPDAIGYVIPNDFSNGASGSYSNWSSDNYQYETYNASWISDNIPRMYSTSPIYNNRLQRHNFSNRTFPAITGFFDNVGGILIEIPY